MAILNLVFCVLFLVFGCRNVDDISFFIIFSVSVLLHRGLFFHGTQPVTITWGVGQSPLLNPLGGVKRFFLLHAALCREDFSYYGTAALCCAITMHSILLLHGLARVITDLRLLLLHGQYCYYTGFVLHCIKIVWVHKQPKHFDSWANVALMILSLSIQHELCPCVWVNIKSYAGVPENQLASTRKSPLLNSTSIWGMINIQLLYV